MHHLVHCRHHRQSQDTEKAPPLDQGARPSHYCRYTALTARRGATLRAVRVSCASPTCGGTDPRPLGRSPPRSGGGGSDCCGAPVPPSPHPSSGARSPASGLGLPEQSRWSPSRSRRGRRSPPRGTSLATHPVSPSGWIEDQDDLSANRPARAASDDCSEMHAPLETHPDGCIEHSHTAAYAPPDPDHGNGYRSAWGSLAVLSASR